MIIGGRKMAQNENDLLDDADVNEEIDAAEDSEMEDSSSTTVAVGTTPSADYRAFSGSAPVKKVSRYGLSNSAKQINKVYNALFNGPDKMPEQIVYFGAPGTGKSFDIDSRLKKMKIRTEYVSRVIFHPDYSYGDFVGSIRPHKDSMGIDYRFTPGPLTKALRCAFENPQKDIYVVIEEINRGNAAAIFGDLFQLLDREISGRSKYKISNSDIASEICKNAFLKPFFKDEKIWFPNNLNFLCTMNTADQNVFILDSAFKRRFHMKYVKIDYEKMYADKLLAGFIATTPVFDGKKALVDIFKDTELEEYANDLDSKGRLIRNWPTFALLVNKVIDIVNKNEGEQISEDKKLGAFYVLLDEISDKEMFADKVLYYLKQDVFKYMDNYFSESYQVMYDEFVNGNIDIFELLLPGEN